MNLPQHLFDIQNVSYAFISLILFSVLMGSFLVYCLRTKNTHKSYKEQIALLEARSLRAQMNPHFIFNVLNGLQSILILKSEQEVNRYMGHLSNLLRMTLDLSKKEAINLGEEIGYLKSYIELQRIRLNNRLDYCIDISIDIETSNIYIPPLLIQPIVENAILHGIVPSKNKGILVISVKKNQNGLRFVVEDNCIGLERSKNQKKNFKTHHKSLGNKILRERLDILNTNQNEQITFHIGNLDVEGVSSGTCATLNVPYSIMKKIEPKSTLEFLIPEKN
jgi:LytS/YehU family sensor histidine kinase